MYGLRIHSLTAAWTPSKTAVEAFPGLRRSG
jgi:hypothetical protein